MFGGVHDLLAFDEKGIETFHEKIADTGRREGHKYVLVKVSKGIV
jgi:hypothetical protein